MEQPYFTQSQPFGRYKSVEDACTFAQAIVDTIREPLLVLDEELRVLAASRSFYSTFHVDRKATEGQMIYALGDGQWDIPELRLLLERIIPEQGVMDSYEIEREFQEIGHRTMLLNARKTFHKGASPPTILLAIEDVSERRASERAMQRLLEQKDTLLREMSHRIANSLQIIASILMLKVRSVQSDETRQLLHDVHRRVLSVASVQQHLQTSALDEDIDVASYLTKLCEALRGSMITETQPISLRVAVASGAISSSHAVSLGLIVTELVINALKHAFLNMQSGEIVVGLEVDSGDWKLSVSDNGHGMSDEIGSDKKAGLGAALVKALAQQLEAKVEIHSSSSGTAVAVTHATFMSRLPAAA